VSSPRARQSLLLLALALCATAAVLLFADGTLPRAAAGIALALLPWAAAARLEVIRIVDLPGGRFAASGGIALASLVLLGLFLTVTNIGLGEESAAIGTALIVLALTLAGQSAGGEWTPPPRPSPLGSALLVAALATVVVAFAVARGAALDSAREGSGYAAFVLADGRDHRLGLRNATGREARFTVRIGGAGQRTRTTTLALAPEQLRLLPVRQTGVGPLDIRVDVSVNGARRGRPMTLSTAGRD
jgi:hypothetical protein